MTAFRFLHAADLHLGSPFQGLAVKDAEVARHFADATRKAFSRLIASAIEMKVAFVVIAGDIYDGDWRDNTIGLFFNREVARLSRAGIPLYFLRGNHDARSVVTKSISLPADVNEFDTRKPESFRIDALKVALHGQGFADRSAADNLALTYPQALPGWFNIGVLHTSLEGNPNHASYAPCSLDDLRSRGYDYWALGHVHDYQVPANDPWVVFPGNLQGRNIRESGEKGAVVVSVADGRVTDVERLIVDEARWGEVEVRLEGCDDLAAMLMAVEDTVHPLAQAANGKLLALRIRLSGDLTGNAQMQAWIAANRDTLRDEVLAACQRIHDDIWLEKLVLDLARPDTIARATDGEAIDMASLLDEAFDADATRQKQAELLKEISAKMPGGTGFQAAIEDDFDALLGEARDLLIARTGAGD